MLFRKFLMRPALVALILTLLVPGFGLAQSVQSPAADLPQVLYSLAAEAYDTEAESFNSLKDVPCYVVREPGSNVIWFSNLFPAFDTPDGGTLWVKGEIDHDIRIIIHPQTVYHQSVDIDGEMVEVDYRVAGLEGSILEPTGFADYQLVINQRDQRIEPIKPGTVLALHVADGPLADVYAATRQFSVEEVGDALVTLPEGLECTTFLYRYVEQATGLHRTSVCQIGIDGNIAYIQGLCRLLPEAWVKGTVIDFGTIQLDFGQLLGAYGREAIVYFVGVKRAEGTVSKVALAYQAETGGYLMSPDYMFAETTLSLNAYGAYSDAELVPFDGQVPTPQAPFNVQVAGSIEGYSYIAFQYDDRVAGSATQRLVTDSLYYQIYLDGELFEFHPLSYPCLTEPTTRIHCQYMDESMLYFHLYPNPNGPSLPIFLLLWPATEWQQLGVQLVYQWMGQEMLSDICTFQNPSAGIQTLTSPDATSAAFDLFGRPLRGTHVPSGSLVIREGQKVLTR